MELTSFEKKSTFQVIGIPNEFGVIVLTLTLIFTISPYLGGADLGIFKVPSFLPSATRVLYFLGPALFLLTALLFVPFWSRNGKPSGPPINFVNSKSKYRLQSIEDIAKIEDTNKPSQRTQEQRIDKHHRSNTEVRPISREKTLANLTSEDLNLIAFLQPAYECDRLEMLKKVIRTVTSISPNGVIKVLKLFYEHERTRVLKLLYPRISPSPSPVETYAILVLLYTTDRLEGAKYLASVHTRSQPMG